MIVIAWYQEYEPGYIEGPRAVNYSNTRDLSDDEKQYILADAAQDVRKRNAGRHTTCHMVLYYEDDDNGALGKARKRVKDKHDEVKWIKMD